MFKGFLPWLKGGGNKENTEDRRWDLVRRAFFKFEGKCVDKTVKSSMRYSASLFIIILLSGCGGGSSSAPDPNPQILETYDQNDPPNLSLIHI